MIPELNAILLVRVAERFINATRSHFWECRRDCYLLFFLS